ncbi:MAG: alpha/beta hydrolase [Clostridia bacterium]|nr:alpha/beta hydrolase [Clostridia bacterium]
MKNYFIIHGTFGHNKENWFGWLESYLKTKGLDVYNFNYPTPEGHNFENWSKVLNQAKEHITEDSIFICHSSAPIFLIKYCLTNNVKIAKLISVSGANNFKVGVKEFDDINKFMFVDDVSNFENLCKERVCFYSKNDPYIKLEALDDFAKSIKAKTVVYDDAGHFNESAGYTTFEDIIQYL